MEEYKKNYSSIIYNYYHDEVIKNPNEKILDLINWLNWDWKDKYLYPHKLKRNIFTASSAQVRREINSNSFESWTKYRDLLDPAIVILKKQGFKMF